MSVFETRNQMHKDNHSWGHALLPCRQIEWFPVWVFLNIWFTAQLATWILLAIKIFIERMPSMLFHIKLGLLLDDDGWSGIESPMMGVSHRSWATIDETWGTYGSKLDCRINRHELSRKEIYLGWGFDFKGSDSRILSAGSGRQQRLHAMLNMVCISWAENLAFHHEPCYQLSQNSLFPGIHFELPWTHKRTLG